MATFLLEIGTEELPADFARLALGQLADLSQRGLQDQRLSCGSIAVTSTPRRLVLEVTDLPPQQPDHVEERKGPPAAQAFENGLPTQAAVGFANRCGVAASELELRETPKGAFVFARSRLPGRATAVVLSEIIPGWISALQGRRFMRWGQGDLRFSRPVRWLVALLDDVIVPVVLEGSDPEVRAGRISRGHRLQADTVTIVSAGSYVDSLRAAGVEVRRDARAAWIRTAVADAATRLGARAELPEALADELTDLVEAPLLLEGELPERYLNLPPEVLSTVMRAHQRYVPLLLPEAPNDPLALDAHRTLLPRFLCVANGLPQAHATVQRGNERVLKARLADAEFFVGADLAVPSIDRRDQLARVMYAEGLGSLLDRCDRLEWLTDVLLEALNLSAVCGPQARRAAHLCKHDLVSQMVGEFPELQGVMGGKYLLAEGEPRDVAQAVQEHYLPRGAGDGMPRSAAGAVVALAERLDLLLSIFAKGERPTGSSDPYALRRAGNGVLQILWDQGWSLDLDAVVGRSVEHWSALFPHFELKAAALAADLLEFMRQRLVSLLDEVGVDADLVQAVAGDPRLAQRVLQDPSDARRRADLLSELRDRGELPAVEAVVNRASRLAEKSGLGLEVLSPNGVVDPKLFAKTSEAAMLSVLEKLDPIVTARDPQRYRRLAAALASSAPTLAAFFDGDQSVMVMAEDPAIRQNRLHLLAVLRNQAAVLADFSRLST